jgi:hypothetical protein
MAKIVRPVYLDPEGNKITYKSYITLRTANPDAWILKVYENDKFRVTFKTIRLPKTDGIPQAHWMKFKIVVENILTTDPEGHSIPKQYVLDPDATKMYRTKVEAFMGFETFIVQYTESFKDESGELIEVGNKLSKDIPVADEQADMSIFGSW